MREYELISELAGVGSKLKVVRDVLEQDLRTVASKLVHGQLVELYFQLIHLVILQRGPHGEDLPQFAVACYGNEVYRLHIDALKAKVGEGKYIE